MSPALCIRLLSNEGTYYSLPSEAVGADGISLTAVETEKN